MWREKQPNGTHRFREVYIDPVTGKKRKASTTHPRNNNQTRKLAQAELIEIIKEKKRKIIEEHQLANKNHIIFDELVEKWLVDYKTIRKESTYYQRKIATKRIPKEIRKAPLDELDYAMFNNYFHDLKHQGLTKSTVNDYYSMICLIIRFGLNLGDLKDRSLLDNLKFPDFSSEATGEDIMYLEPVELQGAIQQLKDKGFHEVARLCSIQAQTGLRYGEVVGLDYERHIDFNDRTIFVERTYVNSTRTFNSPKNGLTRVISFNRSTQKLLEEQIQFTRFKTMELGLNKETLLFKSQNGTPIPNQTVNYPLKEYVHIPNKEVRSHVFRHTFIAMMTEQGTPVKLIAEHVGHKSTNIIEQFYNHFTNKMNAQLTEEVNRVDFGI